MAEATKRERPPLTATTVANLRAAARIKTIGELGYIALFTGVKTNPETGQKSIEREFIKGFASPKGPGFAGGTDAIRLAQGTHQIGAKGPNGEKLAGMVFKIDEKGVITPSSKDAYFASNPSEVPWRISAQEKAKQLGDRAQSQAAENDRAASKTVAGPSKEKPKAAPSKEKALA